MTFSAYFPTYKQLFSQECRDWDITKITRLFLRKIAPIEHNKYCEYISPKKNKKKTSEILFDDTVHTPTKLFGVRSSLFNVRCRCMNLTKNLWRRRFCAVSCYRQQRRWKFRIKKITASMFDELIFFQYLTAKKDAEIRAKIFMKIV